MDKYHITYYDKQEDNICKGVNISGQDEYEVLGIFYMNYPKAVFLSMMNVSKVYNDEKK